MRDIDAQDSQRPSMQTRCLDPADKNNKLRIVYLLLDAGVLGPSGYCDLRTFVRALFYVGKGTPSRPFKHLEDARDYLLKPCTTGVGCFNTFLEYPLTKRQASI